MEGKVFSGLNAMARLRAAHGAFHAANPAVPVDMGCPAVLGFTRGEGPGQVLCLANLGGQAASVATGFPGGVRDLLAGEKMPGGPVPLGPWQARWLVGEG